MRAVSWTERAIESEIAYSRALGSKPTTYSSFVHLHSEAVPWGGDFNCAIGVRLEGLESFERVVKQVEHIHRERNLDQPDRYDVYPPALDEDPWHSYLTERGYRLGKSVWFHAPTLDATQPEGFALYPPPEGEYIEWYHERQKATDWYDEAEFKRLRPLRERFAAVFRPYWLLRNEKHIGWVYCGYLSDYGSLFDVWIEPAYRGQGFGRVLMNAIRSEGRKQGISSVLVRTSESRRGFYEKCGFRECLQSSVIRLQRE